MKTIEEKAAEYADNYFEERLGNTGAKNGFIAGYAEAQRWISVEEELPENVLDLICFDSKTATVLVKRRWDDNGEIVIETNDRFYLGRRTDRWVWNINYPKSKITHWRSINN